MQVFKLVYHAFLSVSAFAEFQVVKHYLAEIHESHYRINKFPQRKLKMMHMVRLISSLARDEEGAALVEYGLLVALIAAACVAAATLLGNNISLLFNNLAGKFL
jgi:pilus assembly protein Flp/PilA